MGSFGESWPVHQCERFSEQLLDSMDAVKTAGRKAAGTVDCALRQPLVPPEKNIAAPAGRRREVASRF